MGSWISDAPVGPELDADVLRMRLPQDTDPRWSKMAFSTDGAAAMELLALISYGACVTIHWMPIGIDEDDEDRYTVTLDGDDPEEMAWQAKGEGATLLEAICRAATHTQTPD